MTLSITKDEFLEIYKGTSVADYVDLFYSAPKSDHELYNIYLPSKLWRLNNIYTIVNKFGKTVRFVMNKSQHRVYAASLRHPRVIILKSRQQGISTLWLVSFFDDALVNPKFSIGLMAQGQDEAETLLKRVKILWDHVDPSIKSFFGVYVDKDNTKEFTIGPPAHGATIFIRTSFRSTTLQRLHISEMGKIANKYPEKAEETKTGTLQAIAPGNTAVIESTAEGDNIFKEMWDNAIAYSRELSGQDFLPVFLSWLDDPDCNEERDQPVNDKLLERISKLEAEVGYELSRTQRNFWLVKYRELGDKIYQEYPSTPLEAFMATKQGAYYARDYMTKVRGRNRERPNLYDANADVQIAFDLGMNDSMVAIPFQEYNNETRIIDELEDNGYKISYYTGILKKKPYAANITRIILPHDSNVEEMTSGKTRQQVFQEEFPKCEVVVLPRIPVDDGREMVRQMLETLYIDEKCTYIKGCMLNYTKAWDEDRNRFKDHHEKNEWTHGADGVRYIAMGKVNTLLRTERKRSRERRGGFDV